MDLNAVAPGTSPAFSFHREHLSGQEYGDYLALLADQFQLPIQEGTSVRNVYKDDGGFSVETNKGMMMAKDVIWGAGEFQFPEYSFHGA
ncbi:NAD(P)-binding domain-containing protein, partial [Bacillus paralicheniformis]|uniref:NAD(P)-binding domain-containing protein n=1 Tax=Bacillus paralicheniformis TaxID=1648923 RepID=UPI0028528456